MAAIGTRWAAAGIALGLALAAPGLTGLARADAPDPETTATTTADGADPRGAATRAHTARTGSPAADSRAPRTPRAAAATGAADPRAGRATPIITPGAAHTPQTATPPADRAPEPAPVLLIDLPATAAAGNDSGVTDAALTPAAQPQLDTLDFPDPGAPLSAPALITTAEPLTTLRSVRAPSAAPAPITIKSALSAVAQQIDQVLNGLINWLSALPASPLTPVTDFLAGALQLVRRALTPVLRGVDGTYVSLSNRTDQTLAVVQVPNGGRNDPEADPRYLAPGETSDFSGYNSESAPPSSGDVRLRIYTAVSDGADGWQKGELREVVLASNRWLGRPEVVILLDPTNPGFSPAGCGSVPNDRCNRYLVPPFDRPWWDSYGSHDGFKEGEAWFADYDLRGPYQSGQTGTYVGRLGDRSDGYKAFQIEVFKIPTGAISDIGTSGGVAPADGTGIAAGRVNQK